MKNKFSVKQVGTLCVLAIATILLLSGCGTGQKEKVLIYTSGEEYCVEYMTQLLNEKFPQYDITVEYIGTGNHAAKLLSEGTDTECDISDFLESGYLRQLDEAGILADLSDFEKPNYVDDVMLGNNIAPLTRSGGAIVLNTKLLEEKGLAEPQSYEDLLKPEYKGLISMPSPKSSSTGYFFLKSLVNAWGEEKAFDYFDKLTPNILQYTSSGSGPLNALIQDEAAIGLGMTPHAVKEISDGHGQSLKIVFFEEGSPYSLYGQAIIKGKEDRPAVREVFEFLINQYDYDLCKTWYPEKIYTDVDFEVENYPKNIKYADMSNDTPEQKEYLLSKWKY